MKQETTTRKSLTNNIQLRISPKQKAFILMISARKHKTVSTYLRKLINVKLTQTNIMSFTSETGKEAGEKSTRAGKQNKTTEETRERL